MASSAALQPIPSEADAWREAFGALKPGTAPCYGLEGSRWGQIREAAIEFLDQFGNEAAALGWTTLDLFGVHPTAGVIRVDHCGALMLSGERVRAVESNRILFGMTTYYRNVPGRPSGVPVWAFRG